MLFLSDQEFLVEVTAFKVKLDKTIQPVLALTLSYVRVYKLVEMLKTNLIAEHKI